MAINSYSSLQTAVANWLDRSDLTDRIPEFIDLAEARINRALRIRLMESVKVISLVGGTKRYPLPSDYLQLRTIKYTKSVLASDNLASDMTDSQNTAVLDDATPSGGMLTGGFSSAGTVMIGLEQMDYTGISTETLTGVTRGVNGTTAAEHSSGDSVVEIYPTFTAGTISDKMRSINPIQYVSPELLARMYAGNSGGMPRVYTMRAGYFLFGPVPDSIYNLEIDYYSKVAALTDSATTNDMLTNNPDLYLYGSLLEAEPFLMNDQRVPLWLAAFEKAISDIQLQDDKDSHSGTELRVMNTGGYY